MSSKLSFAALTLLCVNTAIAQDKNIPKDLYLASAIPEQLKQDAHRVVRYSLEDMKVLGPGHIVARTHDIVTILDEKGDASASMYLPYDKKFSSVNSAQMLVYDAQGKLIKKYSKSDMYDRSAADGFSMITDSRFMALRHSVASYPITIEKIYEMSMNSYIDLFQWRLRPRETSVQNSTYRISVVPEVKFRYKNKNTNIVPNQEKQGQFDVYTWQVKDLKAEEHEDNVPDWSVEPRIMFAADKFEYFGRPGDISTWKSFGQWQQDLNADVCDLSAQRVAEIRKMVEPYNNDKDKAKALYTYMQQNMRYVSVQLGIGGLKPFPASFVDKNKYGDCKALSNYMYTLLKAAGIRSHYAVVNSGTNDEPVDADFPASPFNHVILCIPFKSDTTWLECTSNTSAFGKLGEFTENRNALIITEEGGKLVNTPRSTRADNQFNSRVLVKLTPEGGATAKVKILSTGGYRDLFVDELPTVSQDQQKAYLIRSLNFKQPSAFDIKEAADSSGTKEVNFDLEYDTFAELSAGNKKFYRPRVFDLWQFAPPVTEKRRGDFYFDHPMQKTCTTVINLPEGFEAESVPENVSLKFSYGTYDASYKYDAAKNELTSTVKFNLDKHVIPAAKYAEMQQYMDAITRAQNKKLVIRKKA